ncbi:MAG: YqgE/AlgH family protein [Alphaproteobacteria bacterium]|nr:YqgE/AlgH family protein [Alphaproteobacteria bacterium]
MPTTSPPAPPPKRPRAPRARARTAVAREGAREAAGEAGFTGQLLIAMPTMGDPRFAQSVIYICAHTDEGAMGIVVNRPLASPSFSDLLTQLGVDPVPPARSIRLCQGGPVDHARGFVLHTADWTGDGSLRVDAQTALTASLDILKAIAAGGGPAQGMLALGYAGWGPGQLEAEFAQNAWLSVSADPALLFDDEHDTKWRRAFAKLHVDPLLLSPSAGRA